MKKKMVQKMAQSQNKKGWGRGHKSSALGGGDQMNSFKVLGMEFAQEGELPKCEAVWACKGHYKKTAEHGTACYQKMSQTNNTIPNPEEKTARKHPEGSGEKKRKFEK